MKDKKLLFLAILLITAFPKAQAQHELLPRYDSKSNLWGYSDNQNKLVIPFKYIRAASFNEGYAYVVLEDDSTTEAFINSKGEVVLTVPESLNIHHTGQKVGESHVAAYQIDSGLFGFIDLKGTEVLDFKYHMAYPFSEGLAAVMECKEYNTESVAGWKSGNFDCKGSFIDKTGEVVLPFPPDFNPDISISFSNYSVEFHEGLAGVQNRNTGLWGYIDLHGKIVIPAMYNIASNFSEGKAFTAILSNTFMEFTGENKIGYIDKYGSSVIELPQELANLENGCFFNGAEFRDGEAVLTIVENDGDCVNFGQIVINSSGEILSEDWK